MKQTIRKSLVFGVFGIASLGAAAGGCASSAEEQPGGFGNSGNTAAGTFSTGGSGGSFGSPTAGSSGTTTVVPVGGTFGSAGTFGSGIAGTAGTDVGGAAGAAGTAAGGTATAGAGGTGVVGADFPANCPAPAATHSAMAATRTCWAATASECAMITGNDGLQNPATNAIDAGGVATRFSSGAKMVTSKAFTFDIDMGSAIMIDGVTVTSALTDYAPMLEVSVSTDNATFTPVACGAGGLSTDFGFTAVSARYVRFVQHSTADSWWSIHDLNIYHSGGDSCAGGGAQTNMCTITHMAL